jgi:NADPH-dependent curcumin reductase CurA
MNMQRIVLASRPAREATAANFRLESVPVPEPAEGQVLVQNHYLSLDPYMRGRMNEGKSYAAPQPLGAVMIGGTAGVVTRSRNPAFAVGDHVVGMGGWQEYSLLEASPASGLRKVDATRFPLAAYLGVLGMPGVTAWVGLNRICNPKPGETVVVSAASGAVGSVVGQLARLKGCRAVGIAGGSAKCDYVVGELKFDACVDYKAAADAKALDALLQAAAPQGIDAYFENVGGRVLDAVLARMNAFGRIAVCGMISGYEGEALPLKDPRLILVSRLLLQGFIVSEHPDAWGTAMREIGAGIASGAIRYRESIAAGLASAPQAFIGLLHGKNFGKQLVKLV